MRQVTTTEVEAARALADTDPRLLALAVAAVNRRALAHPNPDDLAADAGSRVALFVPEDFRTGARTAQDEEERTRLAEGAARRSLARSLARRHEATPTASLDALAEADPGMVEHLAEASAERYGTGCTGSRTPDPAAPWTERPERHAVMGALAAVSPEHRPTLAAAVADYLDACQTIRGDRLPSLAGATVHRQGITPTDRKAAKIRAQVRAALDDLAPYLAAILAAPTERTTSPDYPATWTPEPTKPRRPWTDQARALADLAALLDRIERTAQNEAHKATKPRGTASRIVRHLPPLSRPDVSLFGEVEVITQDGTLVSRHPAATWTPAHTAAVLEDLATDSSKPGPLALAEGVTAQEASAGERAALFQPARVASPSRRPSRVGSTGPTVPATLARTARPRYAEHAEPAPVALACPACHLAHPGTCQD